MKELFLAFDFGTTRLKAAVSDGESLRALESDPSPSVYGDGGVREMEMDAAWLALCRLSRKLLSGGDFAGRIAGIGISGLGEGLWPVSETGEAVRPAFLWNDFRAGALALPDLSAQLRENRVTPLFPAAPPVLLRWMREREPERYRRVRWAARCKDWLNYKLTGVMATDYSDASTAALDVVHRRYYPELFALLEIPEAANFLPELRHSYEILGGVTEAAARQTGIPAGTPVIAGALDAAAISLGSGMTAVGDGCAVFGTCLANESLVGASQVDHSNGLGSYLLPILPEGYIRMMGTNNGAGTISWAARCIAGVSTQQADLLAATAAPGSGGILFLPYLNGERAPFKEPCATGSFFGISAVATQAQLLRSVYEGIVYSVMDCRAAMPPVMGTFTVSGGGARCDLLCAMTASALGIPVLRPRAAEPGINGIVSAIRVALGHCAGFEQTRADCDLFSPDAALHRVYAAGYRRFRALCEEMAPHWKNNL